MKQIKMRYTTGLDSDSFFSYPNKVVSTILAGMVAEQAYRRGFRQGIEHYKQAINKQHYIENDIYNWRYEQINTIKVFPPIPEDIKRNIPPVKRYNLHPKI